VVAGYATPRRENGHPPENETYQGLLRAARGLIASSGYHNVTIDDIRKSAGVSRATLYFYFRNKKHLFIQLANAVMDELYDVAGQHYPDKDEYSRIVLANVAYLEIWARETKIIGEFFALSLVDETIREIYDQRRRRFEERIEARLKRLLVQGRIPETNTKLLAATLSAMVEFFAFRFFATDEEVSRRHFRFDEAVRILSESWYRAVYGRMPPEGYPYQQHRIDDAGDAS
jgi:AcrR family transcriptional regulator